MRREAAMGAGAIGLLVLLVMTAAAIPGVLAEPEPDRGHVLLREVDIAAGTVSGGSATLSVTSTLLHRGGPVENVTVRVEAVDLQSGLVVERAAVDVGRVTGEGERLVTVNLSVPREGGYRIEVTLSQEGREVGEGIVREVRGVGALPPDDAKVRFQWAGGRGSDLPPVYVSVTNVSGDRVRLELSAPLTNGATEPSGDLRLEFVVRQADSNLVAATTSVDFGQIGPGETIEPSAEVTVPDGYNYYVDAVLWKDQVIVGSARGVVNLNPTERISVNTTVREVGLDVRDFEREGGRKEAPERTPAPAATGTQAPGLGIAAALLALLALAAITRRRR